MRILVIEDDVSTAAFIERGLREAGHVVDHRSDGRDGLLLATTERYDAIVLDRMLPGLDGFSVLRTLRASAIATPVIVLSALGEVDQRVEGLRLGADDYLPKPFSLVELEARIDALARRPRDVDAQATIFRVGDLELDRLKRSVRRGGQPIELQAREFRLLEFLMRHAGNVVTRTMLLEGVWEYHFDPQTNVIDVHISRLRAKIDREGSPPLIHTVRGAGYRMAERPQT